MPKEIQNIKKFKVLEMDQQEFFSIGGLSLCDSCCKKMKKGYFIAVLNMSYCTEHYLEWFRTAERFPEDISFEEFIHSRMFNFFKKAPFLEESRK